MANDPADPQLAKLSGLSVGWWASRKHTSIWLLILPRQRRFVVLVHKASAPRRRSRVVAAVAENLGARSPFNPRGARAGGWVCAFETAFEGIAGMDYVLPLVRPGRLVLEARQVVQRNFDGSLERACEHYLAEEGQGGVGMSAVMERLREFRSSSSGAAAGQGQFASPAGSPPASPTVLGGGAAQGGARGSLTLKLHRAGAPPQPQVWEPAGGELTFRPGGGDSLWGGSDGTATPTFTEAARRSAGSSLDCPGNDVAAAGFFREPSLAPLLAVAGADAAVAAADAAISAAAEAAVAAASVAVADAKAPYGEVVRVFPFRQLTAYWTDPQLPCALAPTVLANDRLLKVYESGIPAWAIFMPSCGLWYRPWLRRATWVLFYLFSALSLAAGFWDLYKQLPGLQALLARAAASCWLPPAALLQWAEEHAQVRLSILLTYLFGKSELAVQVVRMGGNAARVARGAAQPLLDAAGPPAAALRAAAAAGGAAAAALVRAGLAPAATAVAAAATGTAAAAAPMLAAARAAAALPAAWALEAARQARAAGGVRWAAVVQAGRGAAAVKTAAEVGRAAGGPSSWVLWLGATEAMQLARGSLVRAARSLQAVWRFASQVGAGVVRHRLTLSRRAGRAWGRAKRRAAAAAWTPVAAALALLQWLIVAIHVLLLGLFGSEQRQPQGARSEAAAAAAGAAASAEREPEPDGHKKLD
jgi:hypothetical protein